MNSYRNWIAVDEHNKRWMVLYTLKIVNSKFLKNRKKKSEKSLQFDLHWKGITDSTVDQLALRILPSMHNQNLWFYFTQFLGKSLFTVLIRSDARWIFK